MHESLCSCEPVSERQPQQPHPEAVLPTTFARDIPNHPRPPPKGLRKGTAPSPPLRLETGAAPAAKTFVVAEGAISPGPLELVDCSQQERGRLGSLDTGTTIQLRRQRSTNVKFDRSADKIIKIDEMNQHYGRFEPAAAAAAPSHARLEVGSSNLQAATPSQRPLPQRQQLQQQLDSSVLTRDSDKAQLVQLLRSASDSRGAEINLHGVDQLQAEVDQVSAVVSDSVSLAVARGA